MGKPAKGRPEESSAHLANPATDALDGLVPVDYGRFSIAVIQADIAQCLCHRKGLPGCDQQAMKATGAGADILHAVLPESKK